MSFSACLAARTFSVSCGSRRIAAFLDSCCPNKARALLKAVGFCARLFQIFWKLGFRENSTCKYPSSRSSGISSTDFDNVLTADLRSDFVFSVSWLRTNSSRVLEIRVISPLTSASFCCCSQFVYSDGSVGGLSFLGCSDLASD